MTWRALALMLVLVVVAPRGGEGADQPSPSPRLAGLRTPEQFLNLCVDGRNHKAQPGPEGELFQQCAPWKDRACCTAENSQALHISDNWLNFDLNHCGDLSTKCREHFLQDLCFYECSPNIGPWLVEDKRKIRNEKFVGVPLCASVCNNWFEDCKSDMACLTDWSKGFNWTSGINTCPAGTQCRTIQEVYKTAKDFCEQVWGGSWQVVPDTDPCMVLWFNRTLGNPNTGVALARARALLGIGAVSALQPALLSVCVSAVLATMLHFV